MKLRGVYSLYTITHIHTHMKTSKNKADKE